MTTHDNQLSENRKSEIIAAIITPPGEGGVAAVRIAGSGSVKLCSALLNWSETTAPSPFHLQYTNFDSQSENHESSTERPLDEVMAVWMPEGHSYTGDEQVEIFCHGGQHAAPNILQALFKAGARAAEPGEFTRRAFLSGRIDLTRAEAVAEMIGAKSDFAYRAARDNLFGRTAEVVNDLRDNIMNLAATLEASIDFPEEGLDTTDLSAALAILEKTKNSLSKLISSYSAGSIIRDGFHVAICGRPNAGKSSLFNVLLNRTRAIVSETPGATRDYLSEWIQLQGVAVELSDTAGLTEIGANVTSDVSANIESQSQSFSREKIENADLLLWVVDSADKQWRKELKIDLAEWPGDKTLLAFNKSDLQGESVADSDSYSCNGRIYPSVSISCQSGEGIELLREKLTQNVSSRLSDQTDGLTVTNLRHKQKMEQALALLSEVRENMLQDQSPELLAFDVRQAQKALDEITGVIYTEETLGAIFANFCVGK